jgi:hypothetical protein
MDVEKALAFARQVYQQFVESDLDALEKEIAAKLILDLVTAKISFDGRMATLDAMRETLKHRADSL